MCWFVHSQDAHELFHVLTSSLEEERDRQPKVAHLFDMQTLEASHRLSSCIVSQTTHKYFLHALINPVDFYLSRNDKYVSVLTFLVHLGVFLYQSPPDPVEKTMICRSRGKETKKLWSLDYTNAKDCISTVLIFHFAAPLHCIPSPWKSPHPFHGRLTSNMSCKRCEQQVSVFFFFPFF